MSFKLNGKSLTVIVILFLIIIMIFLANQSTGTPKVPFTGLREKSVIYDGWTECPNGDGVYITEYQLYKVDVEKWVNYNKKTKKHWVSGPVSDKRYSNAFFWSNTSQVENSNGPLPVLPYEKWLKLKRYYFYLEDYEEFKDKDMIGIVHHSAIWVIDSKTYRLYYVAGSS